MKTVMMTAATAATAALANAETVRPETVRPESVDVDTLNRFVRRLANQLPTQFWLDAKGDGSYSHVAIEVHFRDARFPARLHEEMRAAGFIAVTRATPYGTWQTGRYVRRWEAKRK